MKICPVCNDSFADDLNFCDVDGTRLAREVSTEERNKAWSLLGAGLLVAAVLISAVSIFFLPKARVAPIVNPEPQPSAAVPASASVEGSANVASSTPAAEPEQESAEVAAPELKKKEKELANSSLGEAAPNPKAAALAADGVAKDSATTEDKKNDVPVPTAEATPPVSISNPRPAEPAPKPAQVSTDVKKEQSPAPSTKVGEKDQNSKKKNDDKDKKKGGFLRVFKKIFGKD